MWPLVGAGFPKGHDLELELVRVQQYLQVAAEGSLPRWAPDLFGGYGLPIFVFFPPVFLALAAAGAAAFGVTGGIKLALVALWSISASGMYALCRRVGGTGPACVATLLYTLAPYRWHDIYVRNALSEATALCLVPLAALGVYRAVAAGTRRDVALGALFVAVFAMAHNLSAVLYAPVLLAVCWLPPGVAPLARLMRGAAVAALAFILASFFFVPLLAEISLVKISEGLDARWKPIAHLLPIEALASAEWRLNTLFLVGLAAACVVAGWGRRWTTLVAVGAVATIALTTEALRSVWAHVPAADLIMFPWRLYSPATFVLCVALAAVLPAVAPSWRYVSSGAFAAVAIAAIAPVPSRLVVSPEALRPPAIRASWITTTVAAEYIARTVVERPRVWVDTALGTDDPLGVVETLRETSTDRTYRVRLSTDATVLVRIMWYAGWTLEVDGKPVEPTLTRFGTATTRLRAGEHVVQMRFGPTAARRAGTTLTWIGIAAVAFLFFFPGRRRVPRA